MPLTESSWWTDLKGLIASNCTGGTLTKVFRAADINREDWRQAMDNSQLVAPFWVIHVSKQVESTEWSGMAGAAYEQPVSIYGIYSTTDSNAQLGGGTYDPTAYVLSEANNLVAAMFAYTGGNFQVLPGTYPLIDVSDENPANSKLLTAHNDLMAFMVVAQLLVGNVL